MTAEVSKATRTFAARYGPWALVAGGSKGLGAAFAEGIARRGVNLLLAAREEAALKQLSSRLRKAYAVQVRTLALDLADAGFLGALERGSRGLEIGLLVCNAASAYTGPFLRTELADYQRILDTNCRAPLSLMHWLGGLMAGRGRGGILVMSSLSAFQGSAYVAVYGATKAFLLTLSEALGQELGSRGVDVLACCAGPTRTPNYLDSKPEGVGPGALEMEPQAVAEAALRALGRKPLVVPGALNRLGYVLLSRLLPRRMAVRILAASTGSMYSEK
jgi:short-subunit dehydrogenase